MQLIADMPRERSQRSAFVAYQDQLKKGVLRVQKTLQCERRHTKDCPHLAQTQKFCNAKFKTMAALVTAYRDIVNAGDVKECDCVKERRYWKLRRKSLTSWAKTIATLLEEDPML